MQMLFRKCSLPLDILIFVTVSISFKSINFEQKWCLSFSNTMENIGMYRLLDMLPNKKFYVLRKIEPLN